MKNIAAHALTLAVGLTFTTSAMAEVMSKDQYKSAEKVIEADYKAGKSACSPLAGNANDICVAEAKGKEKIAKAELEAQYKPTAKNRTAVQTAKADAAYAVSVKRCDDRAGNEKDVCVKEAKAAKVHALSAAEAQLTTVKANAVASEKSADANTKASTEGAEARQEATKENLAADFAVAKEKCDALAGDTKTQCLNDAKARFRQN
jgi:hypothetical protein